MAASRRVLVADPHGFCAGVRRAIEAIEAALERCDPPVYCLHEIVHNRQVVDDLAARGVVFVDTVHDVPRGACLVLSAHGVAPAVHDEARARDLRVIDATCPFVAKLHQQARHYAAGGYTVLLIGYRGHDEIEGICGEAPDSVRVVENTDEAAAVAVPDPHRVAVLTQTTLSVDETARVMDRLRTRFPHLAKPSTDGICRATIDRQDAVRQLAGRVGLVLVLGSQTSSNTLRLAEVAAAEGARSILVDRLEALDDVDLGAVDELGLTAGASTPESFITRVLETLRARGYGEVVHLVAAREHMRFPPPPALRRGGCPDAAPGRGVREPTP